MSTEATSISASVKKNEKRAAAYKCPCCNKNFESRTVGPHLIKHHLEYVKHAFEIYASASKFTAPYLTRNSFYLCLCCKQYHQQIGSAKKHLEKCPADKQIEAIYALIGKRPVAATVTIKAAESESDNFLIRKIQSAESLAMQYKNQHVQKDSVIANLRSDKRRLEAKLALMEYKLLAEKQLERDRYELIIGRHPELHNTITEANALHLDEEKTYQLKNLERQFVVLKPEPPAPIVEQPAPIVELAAKPPPSVYCKNCKEPSGTMIPCYKCGKLIHLFDERIRCPPSMCEGEDCDEMFCNDCVANWPDEFCPGCSRNRA